MWPSGTSHLPTVCHTLGSQPVPPACHHHHYDHCCVVSIIIIIVAPEEVTQGSGTVKMPSLGQEGQCPVRGRAPRLQGGGGQSPG